MTYARHDSCVSNRYMVADDGTDESRVYRAVDRLNNMQEDPVPIIPLEWENTAHFQVDWIEKIFQHQKDLLPADKIKKQMDLRTWFVYYYNENEPLTSRYGCRLCRDNYDKFKLLAKYKSLLAAPEGTLKPTKKANSDAINEHPNTPSHLAVIAKLKEQQKNVLPEAMADVQALEEAKENKLYQVTANMMKTVYAEVRMNVPFMYHPYLVELLNLHGVNVGFHHFDKTGATRMMAVISMEMHLTLLKTIKEKNYPCSLIVDTSTSIGLYHYLTVLIQTLENERPVIYFYRLIEVGEDSSADGLLRALKGAIYSEDIDIMPSLKDNVVGFGSDGASVNLGRRGGFVIKLQEFLRKNLYTIWCMSHRLELSIKAAIKANPDMSKIDDTITELTNFYNSKSYKRKAHLRSHAIQENVDLYELHFAFRERWVMSDFTAVRAVLFGWKLFVSDLESIQHDIKFEKDWVRAKGIQNKITSRSFVLSLHFMYDLLDGLKKYSLLAQESAGILIGKETFQTNLINLPTQFQNKNGPKTIMLLKESSCSETNNEQCTDEKFLTSESVIYNSVLLTKDRIPTAFLELKSNFLNSLEDELRGYFPEGSYASFEIFVPKKLPRNINEALVYGHKEIQNLAEKFSMDAETASTEWTNLLISMIQEDGYCDRLSKKPENFWPYYLRKTNLNWGTTIVRLIRIVLVLPASSADAERSFSIMNHIKYDRRASLTSENLDHLMRCKINGPKQLDRFPSAKYARAWVKRKHMLTDDPTHQRKRKFVEVGDSDAIDEEYNLIFMNSEMF